MPLAFGLTDRAGPDPSQCRSGADFHTRVYQAAAFRDGKVAKAHGFRTAEEALEAVGLSE